MNLVTYTFLCFGSLFSIVDPFTLVPIFLGLVGHAPKHAFDPIRLFRWRNYNDYGTGLAGDLYVHLLSGLHTATGSLGPVRVLATGGTRYWKDGRDAPDVQLSLLDYPGALAHLLNSNVVARHDVAFEEDRHVEFQFVVCVIGCDSADIVIYAGPTRNGSRGAMSNRHLPR